MPLPIDPAVEAYAEASTTPEPPHLAAIAEYTRANLDAPQMLTGPVEGRLLQILVWATGARRVLELGTYSGYSAIAMAPALPPGGVIITCELSEKHADVARRHIADAGLEDLIEVRVGPALETIATLEGPFDLVFIDADKTGYPDYVDAVLPKLAERGLIAIDNTLWSGRVATDPDADENTRTLVDLNARLAADENLSCVQLTVRDGITLITRRPDTPAAPGRELQR